MAPEPASDPQPKTPKQPPRKGSRAERRKPKQEAYSAAHANIEPAKPIQPADPPKPDTDALQREPWLEQPLQANSNTATKEPRLGLSGLGLVVGIVIFAIQQGCSVTGTAPSWVWGTVWFSSAIVLVVLSIWFWDKTASHRWWRKAFLSTAVAALMGYFSYLQVARQYRLEHVPVSVQRLSNQIPPKTDNRNPHLPFNPTTLTLEDLFFRDLSSTMSVYSGKTINRPSVGNIHVRTCTAVDLDHGVITVGFYIPFWNGMASLVKSLLFLVDLNDLIKDDLKLKAETKNPGDSNSRTSDSAVFSRLVYIYHEKEMGAEDIGELTRLYSSKGLRVQFRSQSYLALTKLKGAQSESSLLPTQAAPDVAPAPGGPPQTLKDIDSFIGTKSEAELQDAFGFGEMVEFNVHLVRDQYIYYQKHPPIMASFDMAPYRAKYNGKVTVVVQTEPNRPEAYPIGGRVKIGVKPGEVYFVLAPPAYDETKAKVDQYSRSALVPATVAKAMAELSATVEENAKILTQVLDRNLKKQPEYLVSYDDVDSPKWHAIDKEFHQRLKGLRPKADAIKDAIKRVLGTM